MLLYDVIRWWTLGEQAFKCRTETISLLLGYSFQFVQIAFWNFYWVRGSSACSIDVRTFSLNSFPIEMRMSSRPPMTNQYEKSINRWNCDAWFPGPMLTGPRQCSDVFPNLIVFIDATTKIIITRIDCIQSTVFPFGRMTHRRRKHIWYRPNVKRQKRIFQRNENENGKNKSQKSFRYLLFILLVWRWAWLMFTVLAVWWW